ncbi:DEAD/DEAH box helicase family protein [Grimontia sp. NTOU-MAR1]|uniref:DEAD/DEAH box helicase family protein n=1 Tax=Grimontia sp. NTOU-MAR1 TaxID=3111011 RepID=UPI002DC04ADF|nr:DEAD/DEAH box helicase family protein [Grimontia sp. NTOU-MAR1]WRV98681.1 DEAD/DEAH box helicase family protein [Grimontia sp. NTOU-MAR1]
MPFKSMSFCYPWRPYQSRVLDAIHEHLNDQRLHIVAAPGAGKTTLGLEVFRLLGKPTLVLSPTRVIRDQWIDRLKDFCDTDSVHALPWVSNSIAEPKTLTSITYQALHTKLSDVLDSENDEAATLEDDDGLEGEEVDCFIQLLQIHKIKVLILDEAHHLRNEWWRALEKVCQEIPDITLVSLTATPPYDAQGHEWSRYEQLCGPIDEEISVPELVKAVTLCAHQDYVWACNATQKESQQIEEYDEQVSTLCQSMFDNPTFEAVVLAHPWLNEGEFELAVIKQPEIAIALLSFLKAKNLPLDAQLKTLLDLTATDIPELGRHWWQVLIETVLFSNTFQHGEEHLSFIDDLKRQLRANELLYKRELSLERSRRNERSLALSGAKVEACIKIHHLELKKRRKSLRQVFLTDYIRDENLTSEIDAGETNLGAWPVFKTITSDSPIRDQVGLLTGRLSIIPTPLLPDLIKHISHDKIKAQAMGYEGQYQKVTAPLNQLTIAFTALLMEGKLKVLVGTRSLLGEGWDAPAINSLILASSVGSFMLTNQMRGRAIRIDKSAPDKISSIWHLAAINVKAFSGWSDYDNLKRRFDTFVGLSEKDDTIESGFDRMAARWLKSDYVQTGTSPIFANNSQMSQRFKDIERVGARWKKALTVEGSARVLPSVKTPQIQALRGYMLKNSWRYLFSQLLIALSGTFFWTVHLFQSSSNVLLLLAMALTATLIYKFPQTIATTKTLLRFLPVDGALKQMGVALAEALCQAGFVETSIRRMKVNVYETADGQFYLSLSGCSFYESSIFADCMHEIVSPIDNPRYLVIREGKFLGTKRDDYHAVPLRFGAKKETAMIFYKAWCQRVSLSELIYTRTPQGRQALLQAKMKAFSSNFENEVKRQDRWN